MTVRCLFRPNFYHKTHTTQIERFHKKNHKSQHSVPRMPDTALPSFLDVSWQIPTSADLSLSSLHLHGSRVHCWEKVSSMEQEHPHGMKFDKKRIHGLGWKAINWITTSHWWCGWVQACLQPGDFMDHGSGIPSSAIDMSLVGDDPCVPTNYFNWLYQNRPLRDNFQTQQCPTGKLEIDSSPQQVRFWEQENHLPNLHCCITCVETWCMHINILYILYKHYIYMYVYIVHHGNTICTYECTYTHTHTHRLSIYIYTIYIAYRYHASIQCIYIRICM